MPLRPNSIDEETIAKDCADDIQRRRQWQAYRHLCHVAQALDKGLESKVDGVHHRFRKTSNHQHQ